MAEVCEDLNASERVRDLKQVLVERGESNTSWSPIYWVIGYYSIFVDYMKLELRNREADKDSFDKIVEVFRSSAWNDLQVPDMEMLQFDTPQFTVTFQTDQARYRVPVLIVCWHEAVRRKGGPLKEEGAVNPFFERKRHYWLGGPPDITEKIEQTLKNTFEDLRESLVFF